MFLLDDIGEIHGLTLFTKVFRTKRTIRFKLEAIDPELANIVKNLMMIKISWSIGKINTLQQSTITILECFTWWILRNMLPIKETYLYRKTRIWTDFRWLAEALNPQVTVRSLTWIIVTNQLTSWANHNNIYLKTCSDRFVAFLWCVKYPFWSLKNKIWDYYRVRETTANKIPH